jgi:hypothetical protein
VCAEEAGGVAGERAEREPELRALKLVPQRKQATEFLYVAARYEVIHP